LFIALLKKSEKNRSCIISWPIFAAILTKTTKTKMKKVIAFAAVATMVALASCGGADSAQQMQDSIHKADSVAAAQKTADSIHKADSATNAAAEALAAFKADSTRKADSAANAAKK
jgi:hypothetical protein